jgi:hypothetical protein
MITALAARWLFTAAVRNEKISDHEPDPGGNRAASSRQGGMSMTNGTSTSPALQTALAYYHAWTSHEIDQAMTYIAGNIVCQAPSGRLEGAEAFRGFMGPFVQILTSSKLIAAFGDDEKAVVMYDRHRPRQGRSRRRVRHGERRQDH